jgi:glycosyltransferase involved in cell wall biosynthesis
VSGSAVGVGAQSGLSPDRPVRVLHVLTAMNRGGIETWLMQVLRAQDAASVRYELLLLSEQAGDYDAELRELGVPVHRCPPPNAPAAFLRGVWRTLRRGHYDVVHSHVHQFSGVVLALARLAGVPGRLAHSHLDSRSLDRAARWPRRAYLALMNRMIAAHASEGVAVSDQAAQALFGPGWQRAGRRVIPLGLDPAPYTAPVDRPALRADLGIAAEALVIGHIGWFRPAKNHEFLLRVFAEVRRRRPDARLLLIGVGELLEPVRAQADELGVLSAVIFAGSRSDVPALLQLMDVFVFPSRLEGLGLALIEAQMAGLPCISAEGLPTESRLPGTDLSVLPLDAGAAAWAEAVLGGAGRGRRYPSSQPFDLAHSVPLFLERYEQYRR